MFQGDAYFNYTSDEAKTSFRHREPEDIAKFGRDCVAYLGQRSVDRGQMKDCPRKHVVVNSGRIIAMFVKQAFHFQLDQHLHLDFQQPNCGSWGLI